MKPCTNSELTGKNATEEIQDNNTQDNRMESRMKDTPAHPWLWMIVLSASGMAGMTALATVIKWMLPIANS